MCGILLIFDNQIDIKNSKEALKLLENRGPDSQHFSIYNNVFMGQTTLEINGSYNLSNFTNDNQNLQLLYNGEIYNYKLLITKYGLTENINDTKTLTELFNISINTSINKEEKVDLNKIINDLDGMYCFAVHNKNNNTIMISRDIQGEKGCYYYFKNNLLIVSSEIKPILYYLNSKKIKININKSRLLDYFKSRHFIQQSHTIYNDIKLVNSGETMIYNINNRNILLDKQNSFRKDLSSLIEKEYFDELNRKTNEELELILEELLIKNLKEMIPSVKYTSIVSGGIDSSLISYYISNLDKNTHLIHLNCIGKNNFINEISKFSTKINKEIEIIDCNNFQYLDQLNHCFNHLGTPILTHSSVSYSVLCNHQNINDKKVLFTGEGADELFGGYQCYLKLDKIIDKVPFSNYSKIINSNISNNNKYNDNTLEKYIKKIYQDSINTYKSIDPDNYIHQSQLLTDCQIMMRDVGCRSTDIIGSSHGIEIRSVFYRKDIIKFILNCPLRAKINFDTGETKILLTNLFKKYYGKDLVLPKQGFCGFPNEAKKLIKNYNLLNKELNLKIDNVNEYNRDEKWKIINTQLFLENHYI